MNKAVKIVDKNGEERVFESLNDCARHLGVRPCQISRVFRGERKTVSGFKILGLTDEELTDSIMKNYIKKFEKDENQQYFIMRSYIYANFETDMKKEEYHIFFIKRNSNPDAYHQGYMNLKTRRMNRKEVKYFKDNIENYREELRSEDGIVYNLKGRPFDKSQCPRYKQFVLNLQS